MGRLDDAPFRAVHHGLRPRQGPRLLVITGIFQHPVTEGCKIDDLAGQLLARVFLEGHVDAPVGTEAQHPRGDLIAAERLYISAS